MKKISVLFLWIVLYSTAFSQAGNDDPVYLRFPFIPQFTVYRAPDSTAFTRENLRKKQPVLFIIFSPDCEHCQHETEEMLSNIKKFKNTQIIMVTYLPYEEMTAFYKQYKIAQYPQITMGQDPNYFFPVFFKVTNLPSMFLYDRKGDFKKSFEGSVGIESIISVL